MADRRKHGGKQAQERGKVLKRSSWSCGSLLGLTGLLLCGSGLSQGQSLVGLSRVAKNEVAKASEKFSGLDSWLVKKVDPPGNGVVFSGVKKAVRWGLPLEGEVSWSGESMGPRLTYLEGVCAGNSWLVYYSQVLYGMPEKRESVGGTVGLRPLSVWSANVSNGGGAAYYGTVEGVGPVRGGTLTELMRKGDGEGLIAGRGVEGFRGVELRDARAKVGGVLSHKGVSLMANSRRGPWVPEVEPWDGCGKWGNGGELSSIDALIWIGAFTEDGGVRVGGALAKAGSEKGAAQGEKDTKGGRGAEEPARLGEGMREDQRILGLQSLQDVMGGKPEILIAVGGGKWVAGKFEALKGGGSYRGELTTFEEFQGLQDRAQKVGDLWGKSSQWIIRDGLQGRTRGDAEGNQWLEWGQELLTSKMRVSFYLDLLEQEGKGYWELRWEDIL